MRLLRSLLIITALSLPATAAHATEIGIDPGAPLWGGFVNTAAYDAVESTGADWVRINFRLDGATAPDATWLATYDGIVDAYQARGIRVYGLINDEAVYSSAPLDSDEFVGAYVSTAVTIIDHFRDRIRVWELFNEPNDWAGGTSARLPAYRFAQLLQDTYLAVKHDGGHLDDPCWQVTLLSGPLFSFDGTPADTYLAETYDAGRNQLAWDFTRQATGSFPLDGVGYHMYVAQSAGDSLADVQAGIGANLTAIRDVVIANELEGAATPKQIWVSEFGWRADAVGEAGQADRLQAAFEAMDATGWVAVAFYFQLQDFPGNEWGVFRAGALDGTTRRPAADRLAQVAAANRPTRWAHIHSTTAPPTLFPGGEADVLLTVENRSGYTWGASSTFRLGAAPGCPAASAENRILWEPAIGYAVSLTDARLFLPDDVPPGASADLAVRVRAPDAPGSYLFAARMVQEGVEWFGTTATVSVTVVADPAAPDAGPGGQIDAGDGGPGGDGGDGGCGCQAGGSPHAQPALWLILLCVVVAACKRLMIRDNRRVRSEASTRSGPRRALPGGGSARGRAPIG